MIYFKFPNGTEVKPFTLRLQPHGQKNTDLIPQATAWLRGRSVAALQVTPTPAKSDFLMLASTFEAIYLLCVVIASMQMLQSFQISSSWGEAATHQQGSEDVKKVRL